MIIGKNVETGKNVEIDLKNLIKTRMVLEANSGGGKSWAGRRIMEQTFGSVQHIIIDKEGEFNTLREKHSYLLVGPNGEIPINIKSAGLLAKKIMEMKISTILDLSELTKYEQNSFVKNFLDGLMSLKRELWSSCLVFIDEAHDFCPEGKSGKAESKSSVINLMTKGRKRRFCGILMTQRISKLDKDASAEGNNKLSGRKIQDIDRKRSAEELGFTTKEQVLSLRKLKDGEFYMFGPSISDDVIKVKVGLVFTTHEEEDGEIPKPTPTPDNIKKLLGKITDLPKEAEKELRELKDYKAEVSDLKRQVRILQSSKPKPEADEKALQRARDQGYKEAKSESDREVRHIMKNFEQLYKQLKDIGKIIGQEIKYSFQPKTVVKERPITVTHTKPIPNPNINSDYDGEYNLNLCEKKLYSLLFQYSERSFTKAQVGVFTGYSYKSGGFNNAISHLRQRGLIMGSGNDLKAKELVSDIVGEFDFSKEQIISKLNKCEGEIYRVLLDNPEQQFIKEELAEHTLTQYSPTSGGFNNSISRLKTLGIIERTNGVIRLHPDLLEI